jgi:glycosyltransferase involved in cell wall biosynthesis
MGAVYHYSRGNRQDRATGAATRQGSISMKVAIVSDDIYPNRGGVELHVYHLARHLEQLGYEVSSIVHASLENGSRSSSLYSGVSNVGLAALLRRLSPDLVHAHGSRSLFASLAVLMSKSIGVPAVLTPHCFYPAQDFKGRLKRVLFDASVCRLTLRAADSIIALTEQDQKDAIDLGADRQKFTIIPNSISLPVRVSMNAVECFKLRHGLSTYLLAVGRIDRVKRADFLIQCLPLLAAHIHLVVIGPDFGHKATCIALAERLKVADR